MEELYRRAYEILYDNRDFLLAVQNVPAVFDQMYKGILRVADDPLI